MAVAIGNTWTVRCYETDPATSSLALLDITKETFSYMTGETSASTQVVKGDQGLVGGTNSWTVIFNYLNGTGFTNSSTITSILAACQAAIVSAYPTEIGT